MRHFSFFALLALAGALALAGCDKGDSDSLDHPEHFNNEGFSPFDSTYTVSADGLCTLKSAYKYSDAEIKKYVMGCVWGEVSHYDILQNGKTGSFGHSPLPAADYWFETDKQIVVLYRNDIIRQYDKFGTVQYTYDPSTGILWRKYSDPSFDKADSYMQILRLYVAKNKAYMLTLQKTGTQTDDNGKQQPRYSMVAYERIAFDFKKSMEYWKEHATDIGEAVPNVREI